MTVLESWFYRRFSVRERLALLVCACVLPLWLVAAHLVVSTYQVKLELIETDMEQTARALSQVADREIFAIIAALKALRTSPSLASGDLAAFHAQARELLREYENADIILADLTGRQLVNTYKTFGEALPKRNIPEATMLAVASGKTVVSNLFKGALTGRWLIGIDVPALGPGGEILDLSMTFPADRFAAILRGQGLPGKWLGTIFDAAKTVVARTQAQERFAGTRLGNTGLSRALDAQSEGTIESPNLEGIPSFASYYRSPMTGWTVTISVPKSLITASIAHWLWATLLATLLFSAAGIALAWRLAKGIELVIQKQKENEALRDDIERITQHDLKSPLISLISGAGYLLDGEAVTGESRQVLTAMLETAKRMLNSINIYFSILQIENGRFKIDPVRIDAKASLETVWNDLANLTKPRNIHLTVENGETNGSEVFVTADKPLFYSLLANLVRNAVEASPDNETVSVRLDRQDGFTEIAIRNAGAVPAEIRDRFFEKYVTAGKAKGTGLGTYSARLIAEVHGGGVTLDAATANETTIRVRLP